MLLSIGISHAASSITFRGSDGGCAYGRRASNAASHTSGDLAPALTRTCSEACPAAAAQWRYQVT